MIQLSYEVCGAILVVLLASALITTVLIRRKLHMTIPGPTFVTADEISPRHELEHRALVYLMTQKTDSILSALGQTIEQEREKLGTFARNPAVATAAEEMAAKAFAVAPQKTPLMDIPAAAAKDPRVASMPPMEDSPVASSEANPLFTRPSSSGEAGMQTEERLVRASEPHVVVDPTASPSDPRQTLYQRVLPLARQGLNVTSIADALHLPEMEVAMVMRLNAAA